MGLFLAGMGAGWVLLKGAAETGPEDGAGERKAKGPEPETGMGSELWAGGAGIQQALGFLDRVEAATLAELPGLWAELPPRDGKSENHFPTPERMLVIQRWAELDPAGALAFLKQEDKSPWLVVMVFETWGQNDGPAALTALTGEKDPQAQAAAAIGWLQAAREVPGEILARAEQLSWMPNVAKLSESDFMMALSDSDLFQLYKTDPAALQRIKAWMPEWFGKKLEVMAWRQDLAANPEEALRSLETMDLTRDRLSGMLGLLAPLAETQPERVADLLESLASREGESLIGQVSWLNSGRKLLESLMQSLGTRDPERMGKLLKKLDTYFVGVEILMDRFIATHPKEALAIAPSMNKMDASASLQNITVRSMKPDEALVAVLGAPASWPRDNLLESGLLRLRAEDPEKAEAWVAALRESELRDAARITLDLAEAPQGIRNLERVGRGITGEILEESDRDRLKSVMQLELLGNVPEISERILAWPAGPAQEYALGLAAQRWTENEVQGSLAWAASLPAGETQAAAYAGIAEVWTRNDPLSASEWVAALPPGEAREAAVGHFAVGLAKVDPGAGLQWAATLADPADRQTRLEEVARGWPDRNAALAAIAALPGVSSGEKAKLVQSLKP